MSRLKLSDIDFDNIMKKFFIKHKNFDEESWSEFWREYKKSPIVEDIRLIVDLYRQHTISACEFYLKYKDKPELLIHDFPEFEAELRDKFELRVPHYSWAYTEYNEWLFKLAFKDVFEDVVEENERGSK